MEKNETCLFELVEKIRITWETTHKCNYNCKHCCTDANDKVEEELPTERALTLIDEMDSIGVGAIYFSGGEPLKRKDIFDILSHASSKKSIKRLNLATNGSLVTRDIAKILASLRIESVLVSLDGHTSKTNNYFRGSETAYEDALRGIELLAKEGVNVRISTVIWKGNIDYLEDIVKVAVDKGVYQIFFNWIIKTGKCIINPNVFLDGKDYMEASKKTMDLEERYSSRINIGYHRFKPIYSDFPDCSGGEKLYHIISTGHVGPCSWIVKLDKSMLSERSLLHHPLAELIVDSCINEFREIVQQRKKTHGVGCPAMCMLENGDYFSYDPLFVCGGNFVKK